MYGIHTMASDAGIWNYFSSTPAVASSIASNRRAFTSANPSPIPCSNDFSTVVINNFTEPVGSSTSGSLGTGPSWNFGVPLNVSRMFCEREAQNPVPRVLICLARSYTAPCPRKPCTQRATALIIRLSNVRDPHDLPQGVLNSLPKR